MKQKAKILDKEAINRSVMRIAHEIIEKNKGTVDLCIVGIRNRGVYIAKRLAECIKRLKVRTSPPVHWILRFTVMILLWLQASHWYVNRDRF